MTELPATTRQVHLARRPQGRPSPEDFRLVEEPLPEPGPGEVVVRNAFMSVDPYMRGRMNDAASYVAPFALDAPLDGGAVGEVVASRSHDVAVGATVLHGLGWREHAVVPAGQVRPLPADLGGVPASAYLGVLGMPGTTAWVGLTEVAGLREGDTVFVSGAAGAVGSLVGQLARRLGAARVIGSAGSPEKVAWLVDELGFDAAFDYHDGPVRELLAPQGPIDVYFDNVGGEHLEAAIGCAADHARFALCGGISGYDEPVPGPRNMMMLVQKRLALRGFIVGDHREAAREFHRVVPPWVASGEIVWRETVYDGLDRAVEAFLGLGSGANTGKMVVRL